jgi:hypothetical protein
VFVGVAVAVPGIGVFVAVAVFVAVGVGEPVDVEVGVLVASAQLVTLTSVLSSGTVGTSPCSPSACRSTWSTLEVESGTVSVTLKLSEAF